MAKSETNSMEADLLKKAEGYLQDVPKIDTAVRNLLSVQLGKSQTLKLDTKVHVLGENGVEVKQDLEDLDPPQLKKMCGAILKAFNGQGEILDPLRWAAENPQGEEQGGFDRMEEIAEYKVVHLLWNQAKANDKKITLTLGRKALRFLWPQVRDKAITDAQQVADMKLVQKLFDEFASKGEDEDLVWSSNFQQALLERSSKRKQAVQDRQQNEQRDEPREAQVAEEDQE